MDDQSKNPGNNSPHNEKAVYQSMKPNQFTNAKELSIGTHLKDEEKLTVSLAWDIICEEITNFSIIISDQRGTILQLNKGAELLFGIKASDWEMERSLDEFLTKASFLDLTTQFPRNNKAPGIFLLEYIQKHIYLSWEGYIRGQSHKSQKVDMQARGIFNYAGQFLGMSLMIHPQKRETSFHNIPFLEESYRTLIANFPSGGVFLFDRQLCYFFVEGIDLGPMGFAKDQMENRSIYEVFDKPLVELVEKEYLMALQGEHLVRERVFNGKWYRNHILPVKNEAGDIMCGMVLVQNINEWLGSNMIQRPQPL